MLANAIAEMRTYGERFIIADQSPGLMDMSVIRNTNTKIILCLPDEGDRMLVGKAAENRFATAEEQAVMAKYVGWGGIQQAFVSDNVAGNISGNLSEAAPSGWENEQKELLELLSPEEYKAACASTLTSFYTPPDVADGIIRRFLNLELRAETSLTKAPSD